MGPVSPGLMGRTDPESQGFVGTGSSGSCNSLTNEMEALCFRTNGDYVLSQRLKQVPA